jgi:hypothetical protein
MRRYMEGGGEDEEKTELGDKDYKEGKVGRQAEARTDGARKKGGNRRRAETRKERQSEGSG